MKQDNVERSSESLAGRVAELLRKHDSTTLPPHLLRIETIINELGDFTPEPDVIPLDVLAGNTRPLTKDLIRLHP